MESIYAPSDRSHPALKGNADLALLCHIDEHIPETSEQGTTVSNGAEPPESLRRYAGRRLHFFNPGVHVATDPVCDRSRNGC
jgi:hypothetical protein